MASTSTSYVQKSFKYDVFLSFRGEDTRKNFVDHLYYALTQKGIETYKDDEKIKKGNTISDELIEAIEYSKFYIIVFSKSYASSSWCLEELVKIMECQKMTEHTAYPVFYDVEPTEVRKQSGLVGDAFSKHQNNEAAEKWKEAMKQAADLAGWEVKNTENGHEAKVIRKIVEAISLELRFINGSVDKKLVGMESRIWDVLSYRLTDVNDVCMIGIKGMGGIGKTTLARAVFDTISFRFEGQSFVENVREVSKSSLGVKKLQEQVLSDILNDKIEVSGVLDGIKMMEKRLRGRRVLIVLDDVDKTSQLEALAGEPSWFKSGSMIIITTRDEQVLVARQVKNIHNVNLLSEAEAICLFSRHAFGKEIPVQGYKQLVDDAVEYAHGLPLTVKVLGSFLCGKSEQEWEGALKRLKKIPLKEAMEALELSYNDLDDDYKEIFLDVACILNNWGKEAAIISLESRGFEARIGLRVLEQKSLITISSDKYEEVLGMHDQLVEMGRNIVRRLHPDEPYKLSRLWNYEEIDDILTNDLGTQATKCLYYQSMDFITEIAMKGLANMRHLEVAEIWFSLKTYHWKFDKVSHYFPSSLRFLRMFNFPFSSFPNTFQGKNLVGIDLFFGTNVSNVQLWEDGEEKVLRKLRFLSIGLTKFRTFDLRLTPNLERLNIYWCLAFEELHMPAEHQKLIYLKITDSKLKTLHLVGTPNLKELHLQGCNDLVELQMPVESPKLELIKIINNSKLTNLHLGNTPNLEQLTLQDCNDLVELQMPVESPKLKLLYIFNSKLTNLHLGNTPNLEKLTLQDCNDLVKLQIESPKLADLGLGLPKLKTLHLGDTPNLEKLIIEGCNDMVRFQMPDESPKLMYLGLINNLSLKIFHLGITPNLEHASLRGCNNLVEFQMPAESLRLKTLNLSNNSKLRSLDLGLTPNLEWLYLENCYDLEEIDAPVGCLKNLDRVELSGWGRFKSFFFNKALDSFSVALFCELHLISEPADVCPFHSENNFPKFKFSCYYKEQQAILIFGNLEKLFSIGRCACINPESFSESICGLNLLRKLKLEGSIPEVPKDLDRLKFLEELNFSSTDIKILPDSICMLNQLKSLEIVSCWFLEKLPEDLGRLQCLEKLILTDCKVLRDLPNSVCKMKSLISLHLDECCRVMKLPEEMGRLGCLKELDITRSGISCLPTAIFELKGLRIVGEDQQLRSFGFTSEIQISENKATATITGTQSGSIVSRAQRRKRLNCLCFSSSD